MTDFINISAELSEALRQIRSRDGLRTLWIDQICIDQDNLQEKSTQIPLMTSIYSQAPRVIVWLGQEDLDSESGTYVVFEMLRQLLAEVDTARKAALSLGQIEGGTLLDITPFLSPSSNPEWRGYQQLLQRPWFKRVWTYQELVLSRDALMMCGAHTMSWYSFQRMYHMIHTATSKLPGHESYLREDPRLVHALGLGNFREQAIREKKQPLYIDGQEDQGDPHELFCLVVVLKKNIATEPRDKIYGVLGVACDLGSSWPGVDYDASLETVYAAYAQWFINRYGDLVNMLVSIPH